MDGLQNPPNSPNPSNPPNSPNPSNPPNSPKTKTQIWQEKRERKKPLSKWHADRLRILQEYDDYASFEQYIKWAGGIVPKNDDIEYLDELTNEFRSLGGYEFFKSYNLDLPPCGISGYESTYLD